MKVALLLVDLQQDFLGRPGLIPAREDIIRQAGVLLEGARRLGWSIFHVQTRILADGSDAMPHWRKHHRLACMENTPGVMPPPELVPLPGETVISKHFFSAFDNPDLDRALVESHTETAIVAGIYLHGCVRATALDAYARGYRVMVALDATGSTEPLHAEITREYLDGRAAEFLDVDAIQGRFTTRSPGLPLPSAWIAGRRVNAEAPERIIGHANPADTRQELFRFAAASKRVTHDAVASANGAQAGWALTPIKARTTLLAHWRDRLEQEAEQWVAMIVREVGKPVQEAKEEMQRALANLSSCIDVVFTEDFVLQKFQVRHCPAGTIALVTPWNNPVAIPVGKLAPALLYGNSVVWKPSPHASLIAEALLQSLYEAGLPPDLISMVFGDGETARQLILEPGIAAVSLTGSLATGASASALCALAGKPLQAELGGNNALIVLPGTNLDATVDALARSAFSFAGQRCTAIRRFVVEKSLAEEFEHKLSNAVAALCVGLPDEQATDIGPLISRRHQTRVRQAIDQACAEGARILVGGKALPEYEHGSWLQPTLITDVKPDSEIVQNETFGPVALVQRAHDLEDAIRLANGVSHGLVAGLVGGNKKDQIRFMESIHAGILKLGPGLLSIHADAPFGGWKASGIGPPEHGVWDRNFYSRPQAIYP